MFGSNGPYSTGSSSNTLGPAIIIGRKGSYGKVNWSDGPCFVSDTAFFIDSSKTKHNLRWVYWVLQTLGLETGSVEAAVPGLNREDAYEHEVFLPSIQKQAAIADFLDRHTEKIDAVILAKEQLLELLMEKRQALITRAVTQGISPNAPMRDSGIPNLDRVPKNWKLLHLKRVLAQVDYGISDSVNVEGKIGVLRMGDIKNGEIDCSKLGFLDAVDPSLLLKKGDLLFNRTNSLDQIGKVGIFRGCEKFPVTFASYLVRLRCTSKVIPEFLNLLLNSRYVISWARSEALPAIGQANLNPNRYSYVTIARPDIEEQYTIVDHVKQEAARIDALRAAVERTIDLLKERRAALISSAVTGKLEVTV